jgi:hypothetical protein
MGYFGRAHACHAIAAPAMTMTPPAIINCLPAVSKDGASSAPGICHIANRPGPLNSMKRPATISTMAQDFFSCCGVGLCHFIGVSLLLRDAVIESLSAVHFAVGVLSEAKPWFRILTRPPRECNQQSTQS